jgi:hypothetical protein
VGEVVASPNLFFFFAVMEALVDVFIMNGLTLYIFAYSLAIHTYMRIYLSHKNTTFLSPCKRVLYNKTSYASCKESCGSSH